MKQCDPGYGNVLHGVGNGSGTRSHHQSGCASLQGGNPLFQHVGGGIHQAGIDIARFGKSEPPCCLGGIFKHVGGGGVDRHRPSAGGGIGMLLSYMDLHGFKMILRHGFFPFLNGSWDCSPVVFNGNGKLFTY